VQLKPGIKDHKHQKNRLTKESDGMSDLIYLCHKCDIDSPCKLSMNENDVDENRCLPQICPFQEIGSEKVNDTVWVKEGEFDLDSSQEM